jgi:hypothetical protein
MADSPSNRGSSTFNFQILPRGNRHVNHFFRPALLLAAGTFSRRSTLAKEVAGLGRATLPEFDRMTALTEKRPHRMPQNRRAGHGPMDWTSGF